MRRIPGSGEAIRAFAQCTREVDQFQDLLDGTKLRPAKKYKHHAAFPMKSFIRRETFRTVAECRFRKVTHWKTFARYWCRTTDCHVRRSREELESRFVDPLTWLLLNAEAPAEFPKIAARVWDATQNGIQDRMKKIAAQLSATEDQ